MSLLYQTVNKPLPSRVYELLLLGTVADVVPLTGENRYWVRHGLQAINREQSTCLRVLKENARVTKESLSSTDIGFFITPQINALGRLDDARDGVKFLLGEDYFQTARIGVVLGQLNEARKNIEKSIIQDIDNDVKAGKIDPINDPVIIAVGQSWQPGVIGLAASRLVGQYCRPAIVFHKTSSGYYKGSCRSIPEYNMFQALSSIKDTIVQFGGHAQAAGLSVAEDRFEEFKARLFEHARATLKPEDFQHKLYIDAEIDITEVTTSLVQGLSYCEPFGCENRQPLFYVKGVSLVDRPQLLKDAHVKCMVFAHGVIKPVIFFNRPELYDALCKHDGFFDIAVQVSENHWNGKISIEFQGLDVAGITL